MTGMNFMVYILYPLGPLYFEIVSELLINFMRKGKHFFVI